MAAAADASSIPAFGCGAASDYWMLSNAEVSGPLEQITEQGRQSGGWLGPLQSPPELGPETAPEAEPVAAIGGTNGNAHTGEYFFS